MLHPSIIVRSASSFFSAFQLNTMRTKNHNAPNKATGTLNNSENVLVFTKEHEIDSLKSQSAPLVGSA